MALVTNAELRAPGEHRRQAMIVVRERFRSPAGAALPTSSAATLHDVTLRRGLRFGLRRGLRFGLRFPSVPIIGETVALYLNSVQGDEEYASWFMK